MRVVSMVKVKRCIPLFGLCLSVFFLYRLHSAYLFFSETSWENSKPSSDDGLKHSTLCFKTLPTCLMIGVKKSGTTALAKFLQAHPKVSLCQKHTAFFSDNYDKGLSWYRNQMPCSSPDKITIEQSAYFTDSKVPSRVWHMDQTIKILLIVRDPITRAVLEFSERNKNNSVPVEQVFINKKTKQVSENNTDIRTSLYYIHMKQWLDYFTLGNIHVVDGDKFEKDPHSEMSAVESFLGLDSYFSKDQFVFSKEKGHYCFRKNGVTSCLGPETGHKSSSVSPVVRDRLKGFFKPHNNKFMKLVNKAFGWD